MEEEEDEFDALLDEAERTFFPAKKTSQAVQHSQDKAKTSSLIDDLMDELWEENKHDEIIIERKQPQGDAVHDEVGNGSNEDKCFPLFLTGSKITMGLSTRSIQRGCDKMRCLSCDFRVIWVNDYRWSDSCDYYFMRNNVPDYKKLKEKLVPSPGYRSYACQCSWKSINEVMRLPRNLKWVCTKHRQL